MLGDSITPEDLLSDSSVIMFIDNMGVLCSLVLGHCKGADLSLPVYSTVLQVAQLQAQVWFEYVDSNANLADGPSRLGTECPICRGLNIPVHQYAWPTDSKSNLPRSVQVISQEIIGRIRDISNIQSVG